jgi:hypothetical protein
VPGLLNMMGLFGAAFVGVQALILVLAGWPSGARG